MPQGNRLPLDVNKPEGGATVIIQHSGDTNQSVTVSFWSIDQRLFSVSSKGFKKLTSFVKNCQDEDRMELDINNPLSATVIVQHGGDPKQSVSISYVGQELLTISGEEFEKLVNFVKENWQGKNCPVA